MGFISIFLFIKHKFSAFSLSFILFHKNPSFLLSSTSTTYHHHTHSSTHLEHTRVGRGDLVGQQLATWIQDGDLNCTIASISHLNWEVAEKVLGYFLSGKDGGKIRRDIGRVLNLLLSRKIVEFYKTQFSDKYDY